MKPTKKQILSAANGLLVCGLLVANSASAVDRTWDGGAGTTVINTGVNWSGDAAPAGQQDTGIWDGTVQTNAPYVWSGGFGPGFGSTNAPAFIIGSGYTSAWQLYNSGAAGDNLNFNLLTVQAGAGAVTFGSNGVTSSTVFRGSGTNGFFNYSANLGTIAQNVLWNSGGGTLRTFWLVGDWDVNSEIRPQGAGALQIRVDGTGANTTTLNAPLSVAFGTSHTIANGTMRLTTGDALANTGTQTLTIDGGGGVKRLALTNFVYLNPAVANINIGGRNSTTGAAEAAIYNISDDNTINGTVRFNNVGGTNVVVYNAAGTLTLNNNLTAGTVTGDRYFRFDGPGSTIVNGAIENGSANLGIALESGALTLNNANTFTGNTLINGGALTVGHNLALANSTVVVNGGTLRLNGAGGINPTVAGLSGSGIVDSPSGGSPTLTVGSNNVSSTFSGSINNTGGSTVALTKIGSGTLTLAGANTYTGNTTVNAGTLLVNGSTAAGSAVTVASGATLGGTNTIGGTVNWQSGSSALFTLTPVVGGGSNATALTVSGSVTLNGNSVTVNVPGGTPLGAGSYKLMGYNNTGSSGAFAASPSYTGAGAALGTSSSISTSGGVVTLNVTFTGVVSTWTNDVDGNWTTGANWSSNPYYPQASGDTATLGISSAYRTVTLNSAVSVGTVSFTNANSFNVADAGSAMTFAGPAGALINVAAGSSNALSPAINLNTNLSIATASGTSLAMTNTISNSGGTRTLAVSGAGTVVLAGNNTYGPAAGTVGTTLNGGVLQLDRNTALGAGDLSVPSNATVRAGVAMTLANNMIVNSGATATVDNNGNDVTLSGTVSGAGGLGKNGAGTLSLSGANSFAGGANIGAGTVKLLNASGLPVNANVNMGAGTTLDLNGNSPVLGALNSTFSDSTVESLSGGSVTLTVGQTNAFGTFAGSIKNTAGTLTLVKSGTGVQTLTGTNTYSGGTTINQGTLQIGNGGTTGTLGSGTLLNNGNLSFNLTGTNIFAQQITGTGSVSLANSALNLRLYGNNTFTGPISITYGGGGHLWFTNASALGIGPKTVLCNSGGNSLHLDGTSGNINVDSSISFELSNGSGVLYNEGGSNTISGSVGMVNGNGNSLVVVNSGFLTLAGPVGTVAGNNNRTLVLGGAGNGLVSGDITDAGPICSVTKQDAGTWTLTGIGNTYSGATTVSGGTLVINGDHTGTGAFAVNGGTLLVNGNTYGGGAVTVASGATLGGTGFIYSGVTLQSGATGTFTVTESGGMNTTPLTVYGNVALNGNSLTVFVPGGTPLPPGSYTLLSEGNTALYTITGSFATTATVTGAGIQAGTLASVVSSATEVKLVVVESSTWTFNGNGNWTTGANWSSNPNYPDAAGEVALLGVGSSLITINLNASQTIGGVSFTNANSFAITNAANTLTMDNSAQGANISVMAGVSNAIATGVALNDNTSISTAAGSALAISGNVSSFSALNLGGAGTVSLSGNNNHSGGTALSGGTLVLGSTTALGSGTLTLAGGSLDSSVPNLVNANNNPQTWSGSFTFLGSGNLDLGNGFVDAGSTAKTITVNSNSLTVGGTISGTGVLTKGGNGTLVLKGANGGHSGGVTITGGALALGDDSALGTGTLNLSGNNVVIRSTDGTARTFANNVGVNAFDGPSIMGGTADLTFTGPVNCGSFQKRFVISNSVTTFSGEFQGGTSQNQANIKDGPGTLILSGDNSALAKFIEVREGTLALGTATAIGTGALTMTGGGLDSLVTDLLNTGNNPQNWNGSFHFKGTENLNMGTGGVTLNANATVTVSNNTLTVGGAVIGAANNLTKAGAGMLVLNGANNYAETTVNAGTLAIAQATLATNKAVSIATNAVLQLNFSTTNQVGGLKLNGVSQPNGVYGSSTPGGYLAGTGSLLVVNVGPSGPAQLTNSVSGSTLSLSWPADGWRLQVQTNSRSIGLSNNWTTVTDGSVTSTNITINKVDPTVFYRLIYP